MKRRQFLEFCGLLTASSFYPRSVAAAEASRAERPAGDVLQADIVVIGGGLGGCAAALAATRLGARVVLTEPTDWIGGQLSQQAVPPDEHRWIESFGCTRSYRQLRNNIRAYYRRHYPLTESARATENLNPGNGSVSRICHEPRTAVAVLDAMLAPAISSGRLQMLLETAPVAASTSGDRVESVKLRRADGETLTVVAKYFIDASEQGDLLPLTGTEYVTGAESQAETGEPHAAPEAQPQNIQCSTWCFAIDHLDGEDHTIERPEMYDFWRDHEPDLTPPWPGKLLQLAYSSPRTLERRELQFVPPIGDTPAPRTETLNLWLYRRILDRRNFVPGLLRSDVTLVNWPQNDYMLGNLHEVDEATLQKNLHQAQQLSLSLLYWLQTEAPRPDGGTGWPGLRLRGDLTGTDHGLAKYPYIRESRRIQGEFTILEQHITPGPQKERQGTDKPRLAEPFPDAVGIGYYHLDLHPSTGGDNYIDTQSLPFQIPLGALLPKRMENLLPACKNLATTHISNGCYRLHPVEWNIGEAAGALAAFCGRKNEPPRRVRHQQALLKEFQSLLVKQGFELDWSQLDG